MNKRIQRVIYYIENQLDDELDIALLAEISSYSHYHFCRVFKAQIGESVMVYITRLRLESASREVEFGNKQMVDIALNVGFQTPSGFLKAFKKHFGATPTGYKRMSKEAIKNYQEIAMETPEIVIRDMSFVVFSREVGDYSKSSDIAWKRLSKGLSALGKEIDLDVELDMKKAELLGICYDDPKVTDEEKIRYDACIAWSESEVDFLKEKGFETKTITGGKYAKILHKGSDETSENSWYGLYAWIEKNNIELRDEPAFEKYLNRTEEVKPSELLTEIYVPVIIN